MDIAPQYSSIIMGISNTFATLPGILSPILTGAILQNEASIHHSRSDPHLVGRFIKNWIIFYEMLVLYLIVLQKIDWQTVNIYQIA